MEQNTGRSRREQTALGRLHFLQRPPLEIKVHSEASREEEEKRFLQAQKGSLAQLNGLYEQAKHRAGHEMAAVFAVHAMLLEEEDFLSAVWAMIWEKGVTAEYAVQVVWGKFAAIFESMENPYMQARAVDIRDICYRMLRHLLHIRPEDPLRRGPAILVADEFLPSEVMELDPDRLLGMVARKGSPESHTAILLQACRIPALHRVELEPEWEGHLALVDEAGQQLYLDPGWEELEKFHYATPAGFLAKIRRDGELEPQTV